MTRPRPRIGELRQRVHRMQGTSVRRRPGSLPGLAGLVQLRTGGTYAVDSPSLALALMAGPSQAGEWGAVVGVADLGLESAAEFGLDLERTVVVPRPGEHWLSVTAGLIEVASLVLVRPPVPPTEQQAERLRARLRQKDAALIALGDWPRSRGAAAASPSRTGSVSVGSRPDQRPPGGGRGRRDRRPEPPGAAVAARSRPDRHRPDRAAFVRSSSRRRADDRNPQVRYGEECRRPRSRARSASGRGICASDDKMLVIWIPDWPVVAVASEQGIDAGQPSAVIEKGEIFACSAAARAEGVRRGMRKRDAAARCPGLVLLDRHPESEIRTFEIVLSAAGGDLRRRGPDPARVCARWPCPAGSTAASSAAAAVIAEHLVTLGIWDCRLGIADGRFAAEHAARRAEPQDCRVIEPGGSGAFLRGLPIAALEDAESGQRAAPARTADAGRLRRSARPRRRHPVRLRGGLAAPTGPRPRPPPAGLAPAAAGDRSAGGLRAGSGDDRADHLQHPADRRPLRRRVGPARSGLHPVADRGGHRRWLDRFAGLGPLALVHRRRHDRPALLAAAG